MHLKIYSIAEVVALTQEDGDIEHTKKILENDTMLRKNCWSLLCDSKNPATWQKKTEVSVKRAIGKIAARKDRETADTSRTHKDAKLHESS